MKCMKEELKHQSHPDEMGGPFPSCFQLTYADWRAAQDWAKMLPLQLIFPNQSKQKFCIPSTTYLASKPSTTNAREALAKWNQKVTPIQGETFDIFFNRRSNFYKLTALKPADSLCPFVLFACTCPMYWKKAHCKHSIGLGILRGLFCVPADSSIAVIGPAGKRGRKPLAKNVCYGSANADPNKKPKAA